jgi:glycerol kinase
MQFQADLMNAPVHRPSCVETTAMGASYLAGLAVGFWEDKEDVKRYWSIEREFLPEREESWREEEIKGWNKAVNATRNWAKE